jgi:putative nucleotidyltransferase with HDIG domain
LSTIEALVSSIEAKDPYTEGHSRRVTLYSLLIAYELGLNSAQRESLRLTGLLHDIGKIGIPESVLNKPEKLDATEYAVIQKHSVIGESILKSIPQLKPVSVSIRHHHERFDGKGYPDRLDRENIPLLSRIIMVADSYDSMTTDRSYRQAKGADHARDELDRCSGTQFDPAIVSAFLNIKMNCYDLQQLVKFSQDNQLWKMLFLRNEFE